MGGKNTGKLLSETMSKYVIENFHTELNSSVRVEFNETHDRINVSGTRHWKQKIALDLFLAGNKFISF